LIGLSVLGRLALGSGEKAVAPAGSISLKGLFEVIHEFVVGLSEQVIGHDGRKFAPMFAAIFFFVLVNNLLGLLPGMTPATDNLNTTIAIGIFSFLAYNYYGFKEHGISYLKQFLGPVLLMAPLMVVIELISHVVRPFSLGLRLYGNMVGDHTVLSIFLDLAGYFFVPVIFYFLGMFVCFMQAFVFMMLTMIYVSMAISHDH
ncbi:MAG: F0F1 ATP synthase subunit A, partial [Bdellovibrionales bacterium]|nr:F0F1 ATP synthase subunit A [Bdellovibrionales bacterium]